MTSQVSLAFLTVSDGIVTAYDGYDHLIKTGRFGTSPAAALNKLGYEKYDILRTNVNLPTNLEAKHISTKYTLRRDGASKTRYSFAFLTVVNGYVIDHDGYDVGIKTGFNGDTPATALNKICRAGYDVYQTQDGIVPSSKGDILQTTYLMRLVKE